MELFMTETDYIVQDGEFSLWCDRSSGKLVPKQGDSLLSAWNPVCMGVFYGVIGKLKFHPDSDWRLLLVRQREEVGTIAGHHIYKIKKLAVLPLTTADPVQDIDLELCSKHHFGIKKQERMAVPENQVLLQKTWKSIKTAAENVTSKSKKENKDKEKFERRIYEELLKMYNDSDFFYFSDTYDLTNSLQRQNVDGYQGEKPMWERTDERFFWNKPLLAELMEEGNDLSCHWILPIIQGFVQMETCVMDFDEDKNSSPGASPEFNSTFRMAPLSYNISLISRRSRHRAGTRSRKRGIDETGAVANYVETEQIIEFAPHLVSFVQVRGSIPVFWSQSGVKYRPPPRLDRDEGESHVAFIKHAEEQLGVFDQVVVLSLAEMAGKEQVVGDAFLAHVLMYNSPRLTYVTFDFHEYCRGMKFENVSILTDGIKDIIKNMRYCWVDNKGMICEQVGVFRVNCIDCLDRTNVVQTAIARIVMETQFRKLGLLPPEETLPPSCRRTYQQLWANNGDVISQQYAGTAALKGDFTRTGERKFSGMMKDGMNSANRYYLRFRDAYRQAAIDLSLGQPVSPGLLVRPEEPADEVPEDGTDGEEQQEKEENLKQLVEDCKRMLIVEPEQCLGGWSVINADPVVGDSDRQEMDVILLLSQRAVYVAWYDDEEEQITQYQRIFLEDVERIEIGAEPAMFKSRFACLRLYYRHFADEGFFHTIRIPSVRLFNNVMVAVKNQEEAKESLRAIAQAFIAAQEILSLQLPVTERQKLDRKKTQPHPEVMDVHQQQQENSLASIHLPRDVSADMRSDELKGHTPPSSLTTSDNFLSTERAENSRGHPPQRSSQSSPSRSPLPSPQQAAASALNMLSQFSAKTSAKNLAFLKPNIKVNLASLNPIRQFRRQNQAQDGIIEADIAETATTNIQAQDERGLAACERRKSADYNMSHMEEGYDKERERKVSIKEDNAEGAVVGDNAKKERDIGQQKKVMVRLKKDWQEISLDSCGILATSPTSLLVSSFKWDKTVRCSLDLDFDTDSNASDHKADTIQPSPLVLSAENKTEEDTGSNLNAKTFTTPDVVCSEVFDSQSGTASASAMPQNSGERAEADVTMRKPAGRLKKSSSVEDLNLQDGHVSDEDSYCVLEVEEVAAILRKSQLLNHPHMKTSLSDNSLMLQQQGPNSSQDTISSARPDNNPFSRFKMKMSTLAVPKASSGRNQTALNISKSHIRKSQRAMEVFERLVREKLRGAECQSRIIFI